MQRWIESLQCNRTAVRCARGRDLFRLQISVFDTINKHGKYTQKVRRLGEFHPELRSGQGNDGQDIDDPLYGNDGGIGELVGHLPGSLPLSSLPSLNLTICAQIRLDVYGALVILHQVSVYSHRHNSATLISAA
jgi:hypothetical protein